MAYTIEIDGIDKTSSLLAGTLSLNLNVERSACYLTIKTDADALGETDGAIVGQDIKVKDDGTAIFGGVIKELSIVRLEPKLGTDTLLALDLVCSDYNDVLARRVTSTTQYNKTAGDIVTIVVQQILGMAGFDDNIGLGTVQAGATFPVYSAVAKSCKDILDELATASGFKWFIDPNKDLHFIDDSAIVDAPYDLLESSSFTDFKIDNLSISLENYCNKQWVLGGNNSEGVPIIINSQDLVEIADRATVEGTSGVYGNIINASDVQREADAIVIASNGLKKYGKIPYTITFTTFTNSFVPNTKLMVNLPTIGIFENMYFLIENVEIQNVANRLISTVTATRRNNASFSTQKTEDYKDYFAKLIGQKSGSGGASVVSDINYIANSNAGAVSVISTSETTVCTYNIPFTSRSKVLIYFDATVEPDVAMVVTSKVYFDGVALAKQPKNYLATSNPYIISLHDERANIEAGTRTVKVTMQSNTGTGTVLINQAKMTVEVLPDPAPRDVFNFNVIATSTTTSTGTWVNP